MSGSPELRAWVADVYTRHVALQGPNPCGAVERAHRPRLPPRRCVRHRVGLQVWACGAVGTAGLWGDLSLIHI
eukprot:9061182-Pyramimonas_sp.AAC.1